MDPQPSGYSQEFVGSKSPAPCGERGGLVLGGGQDRGPPPPQLGQPGLHWPLLLWGHWVWDLCPGAHHRGVHRLGRRAGPGQGCAEVISGGEGWPSSLAVPLRPHPQVPHRALEDPQRLACLPEQPEAKVSRRPVETAGRGCRWEAPGPREGWGWPGQPRSQGHAECSARASCQQASDNVVSI